MRCPLNETARCGHTPPAIITLWSLIFLPLTRVWGCNSAFITFPSLAFRPKTTSNSINYYYHPRLGSSPAFCAKPSSTPTPTHQRTTISPYAKAKDTLDEGDDVLPKQGFDFSSPNAWDDFYEKLIEFKSDNNPNKADDAATTQDAAADFCFEWHDSVPLSSLAGLVPPNATCWMIGCGNSLLPRAVLDVNPHARITLLDTSPMCLQQLKLFYGDAVSYICGSATDDMTQYILGNYGDEDSDQDLLVDIMIDKGLIDALMCGEGWPGPVKNLLREASRVMKPNGGQYILVSYRLATSTREFLHETANNQALGVAWDWDFDIEGLSNDRVSVSVATLSVEP